MVMTAFARSGAQILKDFHEDVQGRAQRVGAGISGLSMLQQQLGIYGNLLKDLANTVKETISKAQKEINREFTPVIEKAMSDAYTACVDENGESPRLPFRNLWLTHAGPGSYMRMKAAMNNHVEYERHEMFQRSADEVRDRLLVMVEEVQKTMSDRADEVFVAICRDYRSVLISRAAQGEVLPKTQRLMRKSVLSELERVEDIFREVALGKTDFDTNDRIEEGATTADAKTEPMDAFQDRPTLPHDDTRDAPLKFEQDRIHEANMEDASDSASPWPTSKPKDEDVKPSIPKPLETSYSSSTNVFGFGGPGDAPKSSHHPTGNADRSESDPLFDRIAKPNPAIFMPPDDSNPSDDDEDDDEDEDEDEDNDEDEDEDSNLDDDEDEDDDGPLDSDDADF